MELRRAEKRSGIRVPDEIRETVVADYAAGELTLDQIAAKYDVSPGFVCLVGRKSGLHARQGVPSSIRTAELKAEVDRQPKDQGSGFSYTEVRRLRAKGVMPTQIAALLRCPYKMVIGALDPVT